MGAIIFNAATRLRQVSDATWGYVDPVQEFCDNTEAKIRAYNYFQDEPFKETLRPLPPVFTGILTVLSNSLKVMDVIGFTAITIELTCPKDGRFVFTDPDNSWQKIGAKVTKCAAKAFKAVDVAADFGYITLGEYALTKIGQTTYFKLGKDLLSLGSLVFTLLDHNLPQTYERCIDDLQRDEHGVKNRRILISIIVVISKIGCEVLLNMSAIPLLSVATVIKIVVDVIVYSYGVHEGYYASPYMIIVNYLG